MRIIVQSTEKPDRQAIKQELDLWEIEVSDENIYSNISAKNANVLSNINKNIKPRFDLEKDHPLYGYRALKICYAGDGDRVVGEDGVIYDVSNLDVLKELEAKGIVKKYIDSPVVVNRIR